MKAAAGAGLILILTLVGGVASAATAVVRDGTVGADVSLQPMADSFGVLEIDESMGSRPGGGVNLLHSFSVFSVDAGNTALFTADPGLTTLRVISRVTGSEASLIFGTVASSIPGADLFLLNPRGIVFGADASLDVQGSFYASTAQSISMIDGDTDGALTFTNDVRLAFAEPQAFGFLGAPASLVVQGARLDAPDGATLSLSGADVELQPGARLRGAQRINIAAAGTEASLPIALDQWTPGAGQGGLVAMDGATLDVRGERKGTIYLGGRDVSLVDSTLRGDLAGGPSANPSVAIGIVGSDSVELRATTVEVTADGSRRTGSIEIYGGDISFAEGSEVTTGPCQNCDGGAGGAIVVSAAGDLDLVEPGEDRGTLLSTSTGSARNAGDVTLMAAGELYVETGTINSFTLADGRAGSILLDAHVIEVVDGALIVSTSGPADAGGGGAASGGGGGSGGGGSGGGSGGGGSGGGSGGGGSGGGSGGGGSGGGDSATGAGGNVSLLAGERVTARRNVNIGANSNAAGDAGEVIIAAPVVELLNGTRIASAAASTGNAGTIRIRGEQRVELSGTNNPGNPERDRGTRITASSAFTASGDAGSIEIDAGELILANGARVSSSTSGIGAGGSVRIRATERVLMTGARGDGSGTSVRAAAEVEENETGGATGDRLGSAGDISIATPVLTMQAGTEIRSDTSLPGAGGDIELDVGRLEMTGALIRAGSVGEGAGDAGNILVGQRLTGGLPEYPLVDVTLVDSAIETSAQAAGGGDIVMRGEGSLRLSGSAVDASDAASDGGNVSVVSSKDILVLNGSRILARAAIAGGDGGVIEVTTDAFVKSVDSLVIAENEVIINSPETNVEADLTQLPDEFQDTGQMFAALCAARTGTQEFGSFTVDPRPGLPVDPSQTLFALTAELPAAASALLGGEFRVALDMVAGVQRPAGFNITGGALTALGDGSEAASHFERGLALASESGDHDAAAAILINWGNLDRFQGDPASALVRYTRAREQADASGNLQRLRQAIAAVASVEGARPELLREAVTVRVANPDKQSLRTRIFLARQLIDAAMAGEVEALRLAHQELLIARDEARDAGDPRLLGFVYAELGALYEADGRLLDGLGLTQAALQAEAGSAEDARYRWFGQEGRLLRALGRDREALAAFRNAVTGLETGRPVTRLRYGLPSTEYRGVYVDLVDAQLALSDGAPTGQAYLKEARVTVERYKQTELRNYFHDECVAALETSATALDDVDDQTAVVYPIVLPDRLELLVSHAGTIARHTEPVAGAELIDEVRALRRQLENRTTNEYLPHAQRLHRWLIAPYAENLVGAGVSTLVFVPDGALHGIPMGVLHDGQKFAVEEFSIAITPGLSLLSPTPLDRERSTALLAGVSASQAGYDNLPNVPAELSGIQSLFGGEVLLDEAFSAEVFKDRVVESQPGIVHIASHAVFGGSAGGSFLLTHDGTLSIDELRGVVSESRFRRPLELLTLSACETAAGDDRAALGLSGTAIRAGARSALGTLWTVSDAASQQLIVEFYRQLAEAEVSKAQALQRAQTALLKDARFGHPYYWSPYLLISNWL